MGNSCFQSNKQQNINLISIQQMDKESILSKKKEYQQKIKSQQSRNKQLRNEILQKDKQIQQTSFNLSQYKTRQETIGKQRQKFKQELSEMKKQNDKLMSQLKIYKDKKQITDKDRNNLLTKERQLSQLIKIKEKQIKKIQINVKQKQQTIQNLQKERDMNAQMIQEYKRIIQQYQSSNIKNHKSVEQLNKSIRDLSEQKNNKMLSSLKMEQLGHISQKLQKQKALLKQQLQEKDKKVQQLIQQMNKLKETKNRMIEQLKLNIQKTNANNQIFLKQNKHLKEQIQQKSMIIHNQQQLQVKYNQRQSQYKQQIEKLNALLKKKEKQIEELQNNNISNIKIREDQIVEYERLSGAEQNGDDQRNYNTFFYGDLLYDELSYKKFLVQTIEDKFGYQIKRTKMIYKFDPLNKTNFHNYVDGKQNIVVIIKTALCFYLAGWTEGCFLNKYISDKSGLLFSLTNKKYYELREKNKKAISYDDYYLIFGNSEIRLKSLEKKLFSNFAVGNCFYNNKNDKLQNFLGENSRQIDIDSYEIFQVFFQNRQSNSLNY